MIHLKNVTKIYKDNGVVALEDITIDIGEGEFVFIVGTSGSGKSTLIKLLIHEETATAGEIFVDNRDVIKMKRTEIPYLRRSLGMIFQDYRLLEDRTVYENVAFAMQVIEAPQQIIRRSVDNVLEIVGLGEKKNHFPSQLSGGERQRVAIARAIVNAPKLVVADEPTGNLDPDTSRDIMDIFKRINDAGTTIVMATHDKQIVDSMKKRVIEIEDGHIVRDEIKGLYEKIGKKDVVVPKIGSNNQKFGAGSVRR